jgi:LysM repeat protein
LRYGVSWVTLAQFNNLANPNRLTVGQRINIPGAGQTPGPTPSPQTEEIYVVKAGDNLYRIGLAYGISWVQIAEANGIVNPNSLAVGQRIKIPTSAPGPSPQFSHQVRQGQTLFTISLQYGVAWTAIAEANNIVSPYVIFPGQVLVIPGG